MSDLLNKFRRYLEGDADLAEHIPDTDEHPYRSRKEIRQEIHSLSRDYEHSGRGASLAGIERKGLYAVYTVLAVITCLLLTGALLFTIANLPRYGTENPKTTEVVKRYVEKGLEETGAVNIVSGMILDYRAFDTLGESHVLFTALICVIILLQIDRKNMRREYEDYYTIRTDNYFDTYRDSILRTVGALLVPCIFLYGIYVLLNGQLSPGGGFSGGTILGTGLIIATAAYGFDRVDRYFTARLFGFITFFALSFYIFAKGYVFFTGANSMENHIPKGTPGAILSGGLILPLNVAVGLVVACTMFGIYSLFRRGNIGGDTKYSGEL